MVKNGHQFIANLLMRMALPSLIAIMVFTMAIFFVLMPFFEESGKARKREMIRELTESAWSILDSFERQVRQGQLDEKEAKNQAISLIRELRYGPQRKDYFWINDMHPRMVVHPYRTDLEGKDISVFEDPEGKRLFSEFVTVVKRYGSGYVNYMWQWKDDSERIVPKLSYVKGFAPWGWIIGSGIYLDDVQTELGVLSRKLVLISCGVLLLVSLVLLFLIREAIRVDRRREKVEADLIKSEKKYYDLYDNAPDMFASVQIETAQIADCNRTLAQALGFEKDVIIGKKIIEIYDPVCQEDRKKMIRQFVKTGHVQGVELKLRRSDGTSIDVSLNMSSIRDDAGRVTYTRSIWRDITDKKKLENQLIQASKMEAIGTLAGGVAHDFNNILAAIIGYTEISMEDIHDEAILKDNLAQVLNAAVRARELVKQILAYSRQTEPLFKPIHVTPIVMETLGLLRASLPVTIETRSYIRSNFTVMADATQIQQVIMNLCTNASQAMSDNRGRIDVSLTDETISADRAMDLSELTPGPYVRLTVRDTGEGMPPHVQKRIFDPFFTTKEVGVGTGMGLSVVHGIIKNHDGAIQVLSEVGEGTTFHVFLPAEIGVSASGEEKSVIAPMGTERILIVDDEPALVDMQKQYLEFLGYTVATETDSRDALIRFKKNPEVFDLVITDMTMPRMTGCDLGIELMRIKPDIPIIMCTGFSTKMSQEQAEQLNFKAFLLKPVQLNRLALTIRNVLDEQRRLFSN